MEFNEKLQQLRKQKKLTQEELAQVLYVSRTAISKWESGRGYPNIESLKAIAAFFNVTVDELLTGDEVLTIAEDDGKKKEMYLRTLVFGLLDLSVCLFLFLPLFGQQEGKTVVSVSLLALTQTAEYLRIAYFAAAVALSLFGVLTLVLQNCSQSFWLQHQNRISLALHIMAVLLFIVSSQPYAAAMLFLFLLIKVFLLIKKV